MIIIRNKYLNSKSIEQPPIVFTIAAIVFILIFLTSSKILGMTDAERQSLLDESTNFANEMSGDVNVEEIQDTVEIPETDEEELNRLESYQDDEEQMNADGLTAIEESGTNDFFIGDRSGYTFTEDDPLFRKADETRNSGDTECTTETTTETGTETEEVSEIETCEVYRNYEMQYCNVTTGAAYNCSFSSNNIYERNSADKVRLDIACSGEDTISATVDAWGNEGKCAGPTTVSIDLNTVVDWTNLTTLNPHWGGSCVDLAVTYKGGCTVSCSDGNCTESCDYSFKFENGMYFNEVSFNFSRLSFPETNSCTWYEGCETGGDCGDFDSCEFFTETCVDSACRTIKGQTVCPSCWNWQREYAMFYTENNCQELIDRGCGQIGSKCVTTDDEGICTLLENKYDCSYTVDDEVITGGTMTFDCSQDIPCVGDSCFDITTQASPDFKQTAAYLAVVDAMAEDVDLDAEIVFTGENKKCSKYILNAKSCCGTDSGFLIGCNEEEEQLADARDENAAYFVGSYCDVEGIFGLCIEKKESYCTFNSVLARIIQEQGREQIGKGWGSAENSDCSAFTLDEIQSLDFEAMDFSDFIAELEYNEAPDLDYNPDDFEGNPPIE